MNVQTELKAERRVVTKHRVLGVGWREGDSKFWGPALILGTLSEYQLIPSNSDNKDLYCNLFGPLQSTLNHPPPYRSLS